MLDECKGRIAICVRSGQVVRQGAAIDLIVPEEDL
jgi:hypothetical protein